MKNEVIQVDLVFSWAFKCSIVHRPSTTGINLTGRAGGHSGRIAGWFFIALRLATVEMRVVAITVCSESNVIRTLTIQSIRLSISCHSETLKGRLATW
jgi:hypothetical protein